MKFLLSAVCIFYFCFATAQTTAWKFVERENKKEIDVLYKGKLMTSLRVIDSVMKPVLFPINTVSGITVTRGYPIAPNPGDHTDHPHHTGMWLNFQSVNGIPLALYR